ncbi:ATP-binding protein [Metabacillus sp. GX 13764]|uniref:ATP-binding protein n=1 Tax=Metabacillus kandeliae TaxID=2900151 RepID=UPI001E5B71CB|nr:ATP-binding protein [Metabacillus kandeliae]MCD7036537.1 ATP-binding protein [Metabacillus kandeliae]
MLAEKLLLHVLIVLSPVMLHSFVYENRRIGQSSLFVGITYGTASVLCLMFSKIDYTIYWDLRYVPIVLAMLYSGRKAGLIVLAVLMAERTIIGGSGLLYSYGYMLLAAVLPYKYSGIFLRDFSKKKRMMISTSLGFSPIVIQTVVILVYYLSNSTMSFFEEEGFWYCLLVYGSLQGAAAAIGSRLLEASIEKKEMKQEIIRSEKLNTIGEMAASIAHEIRNPLTVVKGFLQLMQGNEKEGKYEYLPLLLSEINRAEAIISDYLNFSKPKLEKIEKFQLNELLRDICQLLEPYAVNKGVLLERSLAGILTIETDRSQLSQAMINLIKNGIEATEEGGKVSVILSLQDKGAVVSITDTGKGMTPEQISRIGTLYYTTKEKGTGLGTAVSLKIIETIHGKVRYESIIGKGTTVTVTLPLGA